MRCLNMALSGCSSTPRQLHGTAAPRLQCNRSEQSSRRPLQPGITKVHCDYLRDQALPNSHNDQIQPGVEQEQQPDQQQQQQEPQKQPRIWCQGLIRGTFFQEVQAVFPAVDWQVGSLTKVLYYGLPAAVAAVLCNSQLASLIIHSSTAQPDPNSTAAAAAAEGLSDPVLQQALLHVSQEAVLFAAMPAACYFALGNRVVSARWESYWMVQTVITCVILFPVVDPVVSELWKPAVTAVLGPPLVNPLVATLQQAGSSSDWSSLGLHCLASGVLGPAWEEVFWRGFFLTALTKVLPLPASVALSSLNFAVLHLSPHNFLPLLVLSACCDCLYLRSGGNLLAPLLLHGLWNSSQVLQIALLQKDSFV